MARKILLADDSVTAQNMGRKILADAGYEVITVNNGSAALKKIAEQKPDLIVLDVYMPGYSGLEVCQRLKDAQETSRVPVLLTVGKLEPFKPEEARRARADGFIVKPFEASELLSALSKLEDKIVPRPETSKPGRFARANAALDEARYDKTVAAEEDSSWKNRIAFPKKKTEPEPEENDDSTFYNPMNKDLRTVVERKADKPQEPRAEEPRVDLGALAPEGLPKDVTPEEIAALAAAAAQVKGKIAEPNVTEEKLAEEKSAESRFVEPPGAARMEQPAPAPEPIQAAPAIPQEVAAAEKPAATASVAAPSHSDLMAAIAALAPEPAAAAGSSSPDQASASSGSGSSGSGNGSWLQGAADQADEPVTMAVAGGTVESGAVASLWSAVAVALAPEEGAISLEQEMQKAYAAFAAAESGHAGAVSVPETQTQPTQTPQSETSQAETSQSETLQSETLQSQPVLAPSTSPVETSPAEAATAPAAPAQAAALEPAVPTTPVQEVEQTLSAAANVATDAITAAVQELEAVAAAYAMEMKPAPAASDAPTAEFKVPPPPVPETPQAATSATAAVEQGLAATALGPQVESTKPGAPHSASEETNQRREQLSQQEIEPAIEEAKADPKIEEVTVQEQKIEPTVEETKIEPAKIEESKIKDAKAEEQKIEEVKIGEAKIDEAKIDEAKIDEAKIDEVQSEAVKSDEGKSEAAAPVVADAAAKEEVTATKAEIPAFVGAVPAALTSATPVSSPVISNETFSAKFLSSDVFSSALAAVGFDDPAAGGITDMAKKESEIAANTAAAWASWRRIRETDPKASAPSTEPLKEEPVASAPQDAAMAVAAGAEKAPEEARAASDSEPDDIASIVDSVLADLRPKIVEEISRKMGKKK